MEDETPASSGEREDPDEGGDGLLPNVASSVNEADTSLPIANISRIMRQALPANAKVTKEAKECVRECIKEFIGFITSEASDRCLLEKRKAISGDDLIFAMTTLGFQNYIEPLKVYLERYRQLEGDIGTTSGSRGGSETHRNDEVGADLLSSVQH